MKASLACVLSLLSTIAFADGPAASSDPMTQCQIYPKRTEQIAGYIADLQKSNSPACQSIGNAAANFQSTLANVSSTLSSAGAPAGMGSMTGGMSGMSSSALSNSALSSSALSSSDLSSSTMSEDLTGSTPTTNMMFDQTMITSLTMFTNSLSQFVQQSAAGKDCAEANLVGAVQSNIISTATNVATVLSGTSMLAPFVGGLAGTIAQAIFSAFEGKNLAQTNLQQIISQSDDEKLSCLYMNYFKDELAACNFSGAVGAGCQVTNGAVLDSDVRSLEHQFNDMQSIADQAKRCGQDNLPGDTGNTADIHAIAKELQQNITLPDGRTQSTIHDALLKAADQLAPQSASLANGIRTILNNIDQLSSQLSADEHASDPDRQKKEAAEMNDLLASLEVVNRNAEALNHNLPPESRVPDDNFLSTYGQSKTMSMMADKGLALSLMLSFEASEPKEYTFDRTLHDLYYLNAEMIRQNMNAAEKSVTDWVDDRARQAPNRLELFNAILASSQGPIMRHMEKLKNDAQPGGARPGAYTCERAKELAKSCVALASAYLFKVGDNQGPSTGLFGLGGRGTGAADIGAYQPDSKHVADYYKSCGDLIDQKIIPDPLAPETATKMASPMMGMFSKPAPSKPCTVQASGHYDFAKNLSDQDQMSCAKELQRTQCGLDNQLQNVENRVQKSGNYGCGQGDTL
jgi:hypothetical protein